MKHQLTSMRLREAMEDAHISQRDLSIEADINEGSVSQYVNGTYKPGNINAGKMADVLGVNPVWLMGFDVPKYKEEERIDLSILSDDQYKRLKSYYEFLLSEMNK